MTPEQFAKTESLFHRAQGLPPAERGAFLEKECAGDPEVRAEVEKLLAAATPDATLDAIRRDVSHALGEVGVSVSHVGGPSIPGYEIIREIGRGGMGVVYEAHQVRLNRRVALKVLPASLGSISREAVARFEHEATAAAKLHHTNIVPVYDFGESNHVSYYAMELVEGSPLAEIIRRLAEADAVRASPAALAEILNLSWRDNDRGDGSASSRGSSGSRSSASDSGGSRQGHAYFRLVARWMADAADALHYAHSRGIIHRDIKPGNLMLSSDGRLMILDFGLAKSMSEVSVTKTGSLVGTLRYMSPEQAMAKRMNVDHRTDIYSLGATLYELLTFAPPFVGSDDRELLGQIVTKEPTSPRKLVSSIPRELETICLKTMEKDAASRYATAKDFADDLRRYVQDLPIVARPTGPIGRGVKFIRRRPAASISIVAVTLAVIFLVLGVRWRNAARMERVDALVKEARASWENTPSKNWANAERCFQAALELAPNDIPALGNYARMKREQYNDERNPALLDDADGLLRQALAVAPNHVDLMNLKAIVLRLRGRLDETEAILQQLIEREPTYFLYVTLSIVLARQGRFAESRSALNEAAKLESRPDEKPLLTLAAVQLAEGDAGVHETLSRVPDGGLQQALWHMFRARAFLEIDGLRDTAKALDAAKAADQVRRAGAHHSKISRVLAFTQLESGDFPAAKRAATAALAAGDDPCWNNLILAIAAKRLGEPTESETHLKTALTQWPEDMTDSRQFVNEDGSFIWCDNPRVLQELRKTAEDTVSGGE